MVTLDYQRLARTLPWHAGDYFATAGALILVNAFAGDGWWSFWPLFVWGAVLAVHFLYVKSGAVDDRWADRRARKLKAQSYDLGHMRQIEDTYAKPVRREPPADKTDG